MLKAKIQGSFHAYNHVYIHLYAHILVIVIIIITRQNFNEQ